MSQLLDRFVQESRDLLEVAGSGLLALERNPADGDAVNAVFRAVHTLKGSAGLFDIPPFITLVHAGEDLLGTVRDGRLELTSDIVDLLLECLDNVTAWVDHLEATETLPPDAHELSGTLARKFRARLPGVEQPAEAAPTERSAEPEAGPDWLATLTEADRRQAFAAAAGGAVVAVEYSPDRQCFFSGEDPLLQVRQTPELVALRVLAPSAATPLDSLDPYDCALGFRFLSVAPREEVEHHFRYVPDQVRVAQLPAHCLVVPEGLPGRTLAGDDFVEAARARLAADDLGGLKAAASTVLELCAVELWQASVLRWLLTVLDMPDPHRPWLSALVNALESCTPPTLAAAAAPSRAGEDPLVQDLLQAQQRLLAAPCDRSEYAGRMEAAARVVATLKPAKAGAAEAALHRALEQGHSQPLIDLVAELLGGKDGRGAVGVTPAPEPSARVVEVRSEDRVASKTLKVDQAKVDLLLNLIGELVVAKNGLPFLARRADEVFNSRGLSREIKDQHAVIDRIAQEMQGAIMQVRMLPVSQMFQRFPRLVRDLSRKLGKSVELVLVGEDTEADKDVIETLGDPLLHIVRNSLDHGIELPEERLAAGKGETATVRLKAYQEADAVVIEISDDGRGIDPDRVRRKAVEKGIIGSDEAAQLSDDDAVQLVFRAGFSTVDQVSDLSGRGVGMDVVRTAVEKAGGRVRLSSRRGEGTLVSLVLPLSMAVTRVLVVEAGGRPFGVPMDLVAETVRIPQDDIRPFKRSETFVLREAIVPLVRLCRLLDLDAPAQRREEAVLVARLGDSTVGIVVDHFKERIDIILKPMHGLLAGLRGYAGTALLGDGQVLPVLNLKELV